MSSHSRTSDATGSGTDTRWLGAISRVLSNRGTHQCRTVGITPGRELERPPEHVVGSVSNALFVDSERVQLGELVGTPTVGVPRIQPMPLRIELREADRLIVRLSVRRRRAPSQLRSRHYHVRGCRPPVRMNLRGRWSPHVLDQRPWGISGSTLPSRTLPIRIPLSQPTVESLSPGRRRTRVPEIDRQAARCQKLTRRRAHGAPRSDERTVPPPPEATPSTRVTSEPGRRVPATGSDGRLCS